MTTAKEALTASDLGYEVIEAGRKLWEIFSA